MELPNCCKLYVHREQSVACSIAAESVETSGYDLETFNLKKEIGVCVCVCVWGGGVGGGVCLIWWPVVCEDVGLFT